jgi:hypothetical protein
VITVDTSGLYAMINRDDPAHQRARQAMQWARGPFFVPVGILAEVAYLIERRLGTAAMDSLLANLEAGAYLLDCGEHDLPRIRALIGRYADLPLGYADAAVIACAERHGGRVLTLDRRHFGVVAGEGRLTILPE